MASKRLLRPDDRVYEVQQRAADERRHLPPYLALGRADEQHLAL